MRIYLLKRLGLAALIVWGVLTLTFLLIHLAPGDPASLYVRPDISPETLRHIRLQFGLDQPLFQQYASWIGQFATGNFGFSFTHQRPVLTLLAETLPNTLQLTGTVLILQFFFGILFGVLTAIYRDTLFDTIMNQIFLLLYSVPGFWLSLMGILVFSLHLGWLPSSHMSDIAVSGGFGARLLDRLHHLVLPATVLSLPFIASTMRYVRGAYIEALQQDYIRTALAFGVPKRRVYGQYALKNAVLPLASLTGMQLPFLLGGTVIIESVFAWPGMGRMTVEAIFSHDFPVILATTCIAGLSVVLGNLIADLTYAVLDPRIQAAGAES